MSDLTQYLTKEKIEEFKKELDFLRTDKRKEVAENLEYAKKLGDLSENAEYHEARQAQAEIEDRINRLEHILKSAVIVDKHGGDVASIGSTVKVQKEGDKESKVFKIVGSEEADMTQGKISNLSPIGSAILGKKKGESFEFSTPKGKMLYKLVSVE